MNDMSNKTLVFLLLAAIALSLGGTFVSLHKLNIVSQQGFTGFASGNETGTATLDVVGFNSINITITALDMGSCSPDTGGITVNTTDDTTNCDASSEAVLNLTVQNDGNQNINVTLESNVSSTNFLGGGTSPTFSFMTTNTSSRTGCSHNHNSNRSNNNWWTAFTTEDVEYHGCDNLTFADTADELVAEFEWFIPADAPADGNRVATITFEAHTLS